MALTDAEKQVVEPFFGEFKQYQASGCFVDFWLKVHKAFFNVFPPPAGVSAEAQAEALEKKENVCTTLLMCSVTASGRRTSEWQMNSNNTKPNTNSTHITNVLNSGVSSAIEALCRLQ